MGIIWKHVLNERNTIRDGTREGNIKADCWWNFVSCTSSRNKLAGFRSRYQCWRGYSGWSFGSCNRCGRWVIAMDHRDRYERH